jgi:hypothetical protein
MALIDLAAEKARIWAKRLHKDSISVEELALIGGIPSDNAAAVLKGDYFLMPESEYRICRVIEIV